MRYRGNTPASEAQRCLAQRHEEKSISMFNRKCIKFLSWVYALAMEASIPAQAAWMWSIVIRTYSSGGVQNHALWNGRNSSPDLIQMSRKERNLRNNHLRHVTSTNSYNLVTSPRGATCQDELTVCCKVTQTQTALYISILRIDSNQTDPKENCRGTKVYKLQVHKNVGWYGNFIKLFPEKHIPTSGF
jgi:hypothetical protein